jgi:hypothetical protein
MGVVLKAYQPALQRLVAIKVLSPALAGCPTARRRFTREAKAAAAIAHDHVVAVHGVDEADGLPYLVMQYVAGESLQKRLDRGGPLELAEIVRIGKEAADGLAAAHAQGLIHRDIKPANLLLERGLAKVKITDFGLARMVDDVGLTGKGLVVGTPQYMAPEQARGESIDHRADLFSLGSVLHACCTGRPPFPDATPLAVLRQVSEQQPPALRSLNPEVPAWLETLIARLMAKDPADRLQSAAEVAALLEESPAHPRQAATSPPPQVRAGRGRRPFRLVTLASLCLLVFLILTVLGLGSGLGGNGNGSPALKKSFQEIVQPFKGVPEQGPSWDVFGPDAEECVRFEPAGLRITLPRGFPEPRPYTGLSTAIEVKGDFEVTVHFEILPQPAAENAGNQQSRFTLEALLGEQGAINLSRSFEKDGQQFFGAWFSLRDEATGKERSQWKGTPTQALSGRLRLVRKGTVVSYYVAEEAQSNFTLIQEFSWSAEPLEELRLYGRTESPEGSLDVRITDFQLRAAALPGLSAKPTPSSAGRGSMAKGMILVLGITLATLSGVWFLVRRRRERKNRSGQASAPLDPPGPARAATLDSSPEPKTAMITFSCPGCGRKLRAGKALAGKGVQCNRCGQRTLVPRIEPDQCSPSL